MDGPSFQKRRPGALTPKPSFPMLEWIAEDPWQPRPKPANSPRRLASGPRESVRRPRKPKLWLTIPVRTSEGAGKKPLRSLRTSRDISTRSEVSAPVEQAVFVRDFFSSLFENHLLGGLITTHEYYRYTSSLGDNTYLESV